MNGNRKRIYVVISGRVQGVGFRYFVMQMVRVNYPNVSGWVKNLSDWKVEVVAEGTTSELENLILSLKKGPPHSKVSDVDVEWCDPRGGLLGFDVTY
jgi:acylphosphatase